jgi:hypothetical protein
MVETLSQGGEVAVGFLEAASYWASGKEFHAEATPSHGGADLITRENLDLVERLAIADIQLDRMDPKVYPLNALLRFWQSIGLSGRSADLPQA